MGCYFIRVLSSPLTLCSRVVFRVFSNPSSGRFAGFFRVQIVINLTGFPFARPAVISESVSTPFLWPEILGIQNLLNVALIANFYHLCKK